MPTRVTRVPVVREEVGRMDLSHREDEDEDEVEVEVTLGIWVYPDFRVGFFGFSKIQVFRFDT
jgi:hypothetical protein